MNRGRTQRSRAAELQSAEEAGIQRRMLSLLAVQTRNGRADGEDQAAMMMQMRARARLPAGNIAATMALAGRLGARGRRRVTSKSQTARGRGRWSKGLHPGLWHSPETTETSAVTVPIYRSESTEATTMPEVGVVAVR